MMCECGAMYSCFVYLHRALCGLLYIVFKADRSKDYAQLGRRISLLGHLAHFSYRLTGCLAADLNQKPRPRPMLADLLAPEDRGRGKGGQVRPVLVNVSMEKLKRRCL
jgi:hypothetical protein